MSLASRISKEFERSGETWNFKGEDGNPVSRLPSAEDVEAVLSLMSDLLDENSDSVTVEFPTNSGRILMKINDGIKDVYVHFGDMETDG